MSNENSHTSGPWKAECRSVCYTGGEWPEDEFLQWEVRGPKVPSGRGDFMQADAVLIAAAPDLHRELSHLVALLEPLEQSGALNVPGLATLNGARLALSKANGS